MAEQRGRCHLPVYRDLDQGSSGTCFSNKGLSLLCPYGGLYNVGSSSLNILCLGSQWLSTEEVFPHVLWYLGEFNLGPSVLRTCAVPLIFGTLQSFELRSYWKILQQQGMGSSLQRSTVQKEHIPYASLQFLLPDSGIQVSAYHSIQSVVIIWPTTSRDCKVLLCLKKYSMSVPR